MFGSSGKGGFVRTRISTTERALSWLLLGLLGAVGVSIYLAGQTYDESLFGLDPASLAGARTGSTPANTIIVDPVAARPARGGEALALGAVRLPGWRAAADIEVFTPATLYEKINGRAEQYISYDVVGLSVLGLVRSGGESAEFIDIYVYDMGTPERAFGIYSVERDPEAATADLGRRAYASGASLFIWHGSYYVQVLASSAEEGARESARAAAAALLAELPDPGTPVAGLRALPPTDMVPDSEKYYEKNALGFGFLSRTWSAQYRVGDTRVTVFLSTQADAAGTDSVLAGYRGYLEDFGARITETAGASGGTALFGDMDGAYDVVLRRGARVAGAALLEDRGVAERVAAQLLPRLVAPD